MVNWTSVVFKGTVIWFIKADMGSFFEYLFFPYPELFIQEMKKLKLVKLWDSHLNFKQRAKNLQMFFRRDLKCR